MRSFGIAAATFIETVRQPIFFAVFLAVSLLLFGSNWITLFGFGRESQIARETGVSGAVVGGLLIVFLTVPGAVAEEIRNKQILAILAKPITGFGLVLGKFAGLCIALAIAFLGFAVFFGISLYLKEGGIVLGALGGAFYLAFLQALCIGAIVLCLSVLFPIPAAVIGGFAVYMGGNLIPFLSKKLGVMGDFFLLWLPDMVRLNSSFDFAEGRSASLLYLATATLYTGFYVLLMLLTAGFFLSRKEVA